MIGNKFKHWIKKYTPKSSIKNYLQLRVEFGAAVRLFTYFILPPLDIPRNGGTRKKCVNNRTAAPNSTLHCR